MTQILVNIDIDDLDPAIAFYTAAFELRVGRRFGPHGVELLGAEAPIYLLVKAASTAPFAGAEVTRDYRRHWTPIHLDFVVADLEAADRRAIAAGARRERATETHAWGHIAYFADPFGHGFCLLQFTGRGYDEIADG